MFFPKAARWAGCGVRRGCGWRHYTRGGREGERERKGRRDAWGKEDQKDG